MKIKACVMNECIANDVGAWKLTLQSWRISVDGVGAPFSVASLCLNQLELYSYDNIYIYIYIYIYNLRYQIKN